MPVTVWPVDPKSRRTLPIHQHSDAARVRKNPRGDLLVLGPTPVDAAEVPPLATYSEGSWYRAVATDAAGQVVDEVGVVTT
jgi:hypothetical protein